MGEPESVEGLTDQRYYHAAIMTAFRENVRRRWLLNTLEKCFRTGAGRITVAADAEYAGWQWRDLVFRTIEEEEQFAGSRERAKALVRTRGRGPEYDVFVGELLVGGSSGRQFLVLGVGYATLARHVMRRLLEQTPLVQRAAFVKSDLQGVIRVARRGGFTNNFGSVTVTGVNISTRGDEDVQGIRLTGPGILGANGLYEKVVQWWSELPESNGKKVDNAKRRDPADLRTRALRLRGRNMLAGGGCSLSMSQDGSCKLWLRREGASLWPFGGTIAMLEQVGLLQSGHFPPEWRDEDTK